MTTPEQILVNGIYKLVGIAETSFKRPYFGRDLDRLLDSARTTLADYEDAVLNQPDEVQAQ